MIEVPCPGCRKEQSINSSDELPFFPFCGKKCSDGDLGRWMIDEYFVEIEDSYDGERGNDYE